MVGAEEKRLGERRANWLYSAELALPQFAALRGVETPLLRKAEVTSPARDLRNRLTMIFIGT